MSYSKECDKEYMRTYLETIKGRGTSYKRVALSPLRYAGGKSNAVGLILEHLPALRDKKIVSPFFGGGSLELALASLGFEVVGYDIFPMLVNFWNHALHNAAQMADALEKMPPVKDDFTYYRNILLCHWERIKPKTLVYKTRTRVPLTEEEQMLLDGNPLLEAVYYYYNMQLSYGPMFLGWPSSVYLNEKRYAGLVKRMRDFTAPGVSVKCADFKNVLRTHRNDFLFLDPPYYLGGESRMCKGIYPNTNFAIHHTSFDHTEMCTLLKDHIGGFFITYNDCPEVRAMYSEYHQVFPSWQYTYGQGELRIGKNREEGNKSNVKQSHEIFIICPPRT